VEIIRLVLIVWKEVIANGACKEQLANFFPLDVPLIHPRSMLALVALVNIIRTARPARKLTIVNGATILVLANQRIALERIVKYLWAILVIPIAKRTEILAVGLVVI